MAASAASSRPASFSTSWNPGDGTGHYFAQVELRNLSAALLFLDDAVALVDDLGEVEVARLVFEYDDLGEDTVTHRRLELPVMINTVPEDDCYDE